VFFINLHHINDWHDVVAKNSKWTIGNGQYVNFYNDAWLSDISNFSIFSFLKPSVHLRSRVCDALNGNDWHVPSL